MTFKEESNNPRTLGIPMGDGRYMLFIAPIAHGGLHFKRLHSSIEAGMTKHEDTMVALPEIHMPLLSKVALDHRTCTSSVPFEFTAEGIEIGTGDLQRRGYDRTIFSPSKEQVRNTWIIDHPFDFALVDLHHKLLIASGAYYDANNHLPCLKPGTFSELGRNQEKRTRLGEKHLGLSLKAYLASTKTSKASDEASK